MLCPFSTKEQAEECVKHTFGQVQTFPFDVPPEDWWEIEGSMVKDGAVISCSDTKVNEYNSYDLPRGF